MTFAYNIERFISARQVYERCCRLKSTYSEKQADVHYLYIKKKCIYMLVSSMKQLHHCTVLLSTMKLLIFGDLISVDISKVVSSHLPLCFDISSSAHS